MSQKTNISRRRFVGGFAAAVGYLSLRPERGAWAQTSPVVVSESADTYDSYQVPKQFSILVGRVTPCAPLVRTQKTARMK